MSIATATAIDLQRFDEQGFLVVEGLLDPARDLQPVVDEYTALLGTVWYIGGGGVIAVATSYYLSWYLYQKTSEERFSREWAIPIP